MTYSEYNFEENKELVSDSFPVSAHPLREDIALDCTEKEESSCFITNMLHYTFTIPVSVEYVSVVLNMIHFPHMGEPSNIPFGCLSIKSPSVELHRLTCNRVHSHFAGFPPQRSRWWSELLLSDSWWKTRRAHTKPSSTGALWARSVGQARCGWLQGGGYMMLRQYLQNDKMQNTSHYKDMKSHSMCNDT